MGLKTPTKHEKIVRQLRAQMRSGVLAPGQAIPSYRALMEEHNTTAHTVRHALMTLQSDGLVESLPGIGCVVSRTEAKRLMVGLAVVGFAEPETTGHPHPETMSQYIIEQLTWAHNELDKLHCDVTLRFVPKFDEESVAALVAWAGRWDGVMLMGRVPVRVAQAVANSGKPVVQVGEPTDGACPPEISCIRCDAYNQICLAVGHLVSLGHRRILLCSCHGTRFFDMVTQGFRDAMAEYGLDGCGLEWYFEGDNPKEWPTFLPWLRGLDAPPTAMLVEEGTRAMSLVKLLNAQGWPVPARMSVVGFTGSTRQLPGQPNLTAVLNSAQFMLLRSVVAVTEMIESDGRIIREVIAPKFIPGDTCCPPAARE